MEVAQDHGGRVDLVQEYGQLDGVVYERLADAPIVGVGLLAGGRGRAPLDADVLELAEAQLALGALDDEILHGPAEGALLVVRDAIVEGPKEGRAERADQLGLASGRPSICDLFAQLGRDRRRGRQILAAGGGGG